MPAFMLRLIMGEMGEEFILASRRVQPAKLLAAGYQFRFPDLADALRHERAYPEPGSTPQAPGTPKVIQAARKESQS